MARQALKIFNEKLASYEKSESKKANGFDSFSCADGSFFLNGLEVRGFTYSVGFAGAKCIDFIRHDSENSQWYYEAAIIVQEMIDWVQGQPNPDEYYFHWSG